MTREEQRQVKAAREAAKLAAKEEKKQERKQAKAWEKFEKNMKAKGAWIEDDTEENDLPGNWWLRHNLENY